MCAFGYLVSFCVMYGVFLNLFIYVCMLAVRYVVRYFATSPARSLCMHSVRYFFMYVCGPFVLYVSMCVRSLVLYIFSYFFMEYGMSFVRALFPSLVVSSLLLYACIDVFRSWCMVHGLQCFL